MNEVLQWICLVVLAIGVHDNASWIKTICCVIDNMVGLSKPERTEGHDG